MTEQNLNWWDKHPIVADLSILLLPSLIISISWFLFGSTLNIILMQFMLTFIFVVLGVVYFQSKYESNILRYFN